MALDANLRPAQAAAERTSRAAFALGALGLAAAAFVVLRLFESWRVTASAAAHHITVFGLRLSYPSANADAIVILALAAIGLGVLGSAVRASIWELRAARRFDRWLMDRVVGEDGDAQLTVEGGDAQLIVDARPQAFCAGLFRPRVYISTAAVDLLDEQSVRAVLEHELHHARRRDPLRLATGRVLSHAMFFIPGLKPLVERAASLSELSADERAAGAAPENRGALARAMLVFDRAGGGAGIDPARVDQLTGSTADWRFPAGLCVLALAALALIGAIALLAGRVATGSTTLALPLLSRQPCVVVLAAIPVTLTLLGVRFARGR